MNAHEHLFKYILAKWKLEDLEHQDIKGKRICAFFWGLMFNFEGILCFIVL